MARRREFQPAGLVAGLVFLAIAAGFALRLAGRWHPAPVLVVPALAVGLALQAVTAAVTRAVRRRRAP